MKIKKKTGWLYLVVLICFVVSIVGLIYTAWAFKTPVLAILATVTAIGCAAFLAMPFTIDVNKQESKN